MLTVSDRAFRRMTEHLMRAMMGEPDLMKRIGRDKTSNIEFERMISGSDQFNIDDPLILEIHRRLLESFQQPIMLESEIFHGSRMVVYLWYGMLKEEERLGGTKVPQLDREHVEKVLPDFYIPPGTQKQLQLPKEEFQSIERVIAPIRQISVLMSFGGSMQHIEAAMMYPIIVLTHLLNDELKRMS